MSCNCSTKGNQFYYTRREMLQPEHRDTEPKFIDLIDSFALDYVVRSISTENGERLVILDDFREFNQEIDLKSSKGNSKGKGVKRVSAQSEIYLSKEDSE